MSKEEKVLQDSLKAIRGSFDTKRTKRIQKELTELKKEVAYQGECHD